MDHRRRHPRHTNWEWHHHRQHPDHPGQPVPALVGEPLIFSQKVAKAAWEKAGLELLDKDISLDDLGPPHSKIHTSTYYINLENRLSLVAPANRRLELQKIAQELVDKTFIW
jgi:hypothetical protein